jgi:hypothetical protein
VTAVGEAIGMRDLVSRARALRQQLEPASPVRDVVSPEGIAQRNFIRREGEYWTIAYEGRVFRLREAKGLRYLAHLLSEPGRHFHASDLLRALGDSPHNRGPEAFSGRDARPRSDLGDAGEVLDFRARAEYGQRLKELRAESAESERWGNFERKGQIQAEMDYLSRELSAAYSIGGRPNKAGDVSQRIRKAVTKCIAESIRRIRKHDPPLAQHLGNAVKTGIFCCYKPEKAEVWSIS